jgi:hypothetical protein
MDVANSADITTMPGTNHCRVDSVPRPLTWSSSGPKSARNTNGCTSVKLMDQGLVTSGRSSRWNTSDVSRRTRPRGRGAVEAAVVLVGSAVAVLIAAAP